jgi:SAM-dependent methyltransferase
MGLKQRTFRGLVRQFSRPNGVGGRAAGWVMAHRGSNRKRNVWAVGLLDVQPDDRVLEIGFGPGIAIGELARRATRGRVVGVDHSEVMVRQAARRNAAAVRDGRVDLRLGNAEQLPEFDEPFDKILAVNSLMFWDDPVARLKELRDLLRPGGRIAIAFQPRAPGSTDETAARAGDEIAGHFAAAGFADARVETLALEPTAVVCVLGLSPGP